MQNDQISKKKKMILLDKSDKIDNGFDWGSFKLSRSFDLDFDKLDFDKLDKIDNECDRELFEFSYSRLNRVIYNINNCIWYINRCDCYYNIDYCCNCILLNNNGEYQNLFQSIQIFNGKEEGVTYNSNNNNNNNDDDNDDDDMYL